MYVQIIILDSSTGRIIYWNAYVSVVATIHSFMASPYPHNQTATTRITSPEFFSSTVTGDVVSWYEINWETF